MKNFPEYVNIKEQEYEIMGEREKNGTGGHAVYRW